LSRPGESGGQPQGVGHVLVAADKFKGSLSASEVVVRVTAGLRHRLGSDLPVVAVPVADGGDGTLDAVIASGFRPHRVVATGPTGEVVDAAYARTGRMAAIELASICGLVRLPGGRPDPLGATSFGVGQVIAAALDAGCEEIILGIGGSASTDGGAGMLEALGARLMDGAGRPVSRGGGRLGAAASIDLSRLHPGLRTAHIVVASDVDNPLLGPKGAAAVYGPQKGADARDIIALEAGLRRFAEVVARAVDHDWSSAPGAGAAGGVGFAALAVLGGTIRPGIGLVLDLVDFDRHLVGARLVVTGEGSLDEQTLHGKAVAGVAAAAAAAGIPTVAVAGRVLLSPERLAAAGIARSYALSDLEADPFRCMADAGPLLEALAEQIALDWWPEAHRPEAHRPEKQPPTAP
jgi:glycerate kinase